MTVRSFLIRLCVPVLLMAAASAEAVSTVGSWSTTPTRDGVRIAWTSPVPLAIVSDRVRVVGPTGREVGRATLTPDRRTVVTVASPDTGVAGLHVVRSGMVLDLPAPPAPTRDEPPEIPPGSSHPLAVGPDPWVAGPYAITTRTATEAPIRVAGLARPVEMVSYVVEPAADAPTGPRPVVVFLHGMHQWCYGPNDTDPGLTWPCRAPARELPNHEGYAYIQRMLASQGYFTISIRANGVNAQDLDAVGGARGRAALIRAHLDRLVAQATQHNLDLSRVVLVGHSRGGEGVNLAATQIGVADPYRIVGIIHIGSVNFARQTTAYVPTMVMLPYCDGDVIDLQAQSYVDRARDLTTDDTAVRSTVVVMGANHNFFNTMWTPHLAPAGGLDDWATPESSQCRRGSPTRLTGSAQRRVGGTYVVAATRLFAAADTAMLPLLDGSGTRPAGLRTTDVRTVAIGGDRTLIRPGTDATPTAAIGATALLCRGVVLRAAGRCGRARGLSPIRAPHWYEPQYAPLGLPGWDVGWTSSGGSATLRMNRPLDLTGRVLDLRVVVDPERGPVSFSLSATDQTGATATLGARSLRPMPGRASSDLAKYLAQTVRFAHVPGGLDASRIAALTLRPESSRGRVIVLDASAYARRLRPAPNTRLPRLTVGRMSVVEADPPARQVAHLAYRLSAPLGAPANIMSLTVQAEPGDRNPVGVPISIPAGATSGVFDVPIQVNRAFDGTRSSFVEAYGIRGVATDQWLGEVRVTDDEPAPTMHADIVRDRTGIRVEFRSVGVTSFRRYVAIRLSRGDPDLRALRVGQVSRRFADRYAPFAPGPDAPLFRHVTRIEVGLREFTTTTTIRIPLRSGRPLYEDLTLGVSALEFTPHGGVLLVTKNIRIPATIASTR